MEELLPILEKQIRRYTMGDSTSVPYDKARQLMGSIIYNINGAFEDGELPMPSEGISPQQAFEFGLKKKKEKLKRAEGLYKEIQGCFCSFGNLCYIETVIKGMKAFFDYYSLEYDATNSIITLDYPLIGELTGIQGVDLIYEYLKKIQLEQIFLRRFKSEEAETILYASDSGYKENVFNVCSVILRNALGMLVSDLDPFSAMTESGLSSIKAKCHGRSKDQLKELLEGRLRYLVEKEYGSFSGLYGYLHKDIKDLSFEMQEALEEDWLDRVFPVYHGRREGLEQYVEGTSMRDETLRILMEEMMDCRYTEDKLNMVRRSVTSLEDFKEILGGCFRSHEYEAALELLSPKEKQKLREEILLKRLFDEELKEWEEYIIG
jgi:hypothetical protein